MSDYTITVCGECVTKIGGCSCIVLKNNKVIKKISGATDKSATKNRMKLWAVLLGLRAIPNNSNVNIISDDEYTIKATLELCKRQCNMDILGLIDVEKSRLGEIKYTYLQDASEKEKRGKFFCESLMYEAIEKRKIIDLEKYTPGLCEEDKAPENDTKTEILNKIEEMMQLSNQISIKMIELQKITKRLE